MTSFLWMMSGPGNESTSFVDALKAAFGSPFFFLISTIFKKNTPDSFFLLTCRVTAVTFGSSTTHKEPTE